MSINLIPDQNQLYFLHIPKTAGTTFRTFLEDHYHSDTICPYWLLPDILKLPPQKLNEYQLICGHYAYYIISKFYKKPSIVTMLRDPIDRTVSHYHHIKNTTDHWLHEKVLSMTLDEFLEDPIGISEVLNFQTRFIAFDNIEKQHFGFGKLTNDLDTLNKVLNDEDLLRKATNRLREFSFVGIVEKFNESLTLLSHQFSWSAPFTFPKYNVNPKQMSYRNLPIQTLNKIKALTHLDMQLYDLAVNLFQERYNLLNENIVNENYEQNMLKKPRLTELFMDFKKPINGSGWLVREYMLDGNVHRWTGEETATLDLPLDQKDYTLTFYAGVYNQEMLEDVQLFINDIPVELQFHHVDEFLMSEGIFTTTIKKEHIQKNNGFTRLKFSIPNLIRPTDIDHNSTDTRSLGIYFKWIDITQKK